MMSFDPVSYAMGAKSGGGGGSTGGGVLVVDPTQNNTVTIDNVEYSAFFNSLAYETFPFVLVDPSLIESAKLAAISSYESEYGVTTLGVCDTIYVFSTLQVSDPSQVPNYAIYTAEPIKVVQIVGEGGDVLAIPNNATFLIGTSEG